VRLNLPEVLLEVTAAFDRYGRVAAAHASFAV
jgi:hypothetical protein